MSAIETEEWRAVLRFPGYQVSSWGRVRSFKRSCLLNPRILRPSRANKQRRALVTLYRDARPHYRLVARLVCEAFRGPPPMPNAQAAHDDGNTRNDHVDNLFWRTPRDNCVDRDRHGRTSRGAAHYAAKLSTEDVLAIRARYSGAKAQGRVYGAVAALARDHGVNIWVIEDIIYGRKWRSVT